MSRKLLLSIELVPSSSWLNNVRHILTKQQWAILRQQVASKAYDICQICGGVGPKHPVECHEIWSYDEGTLIQKLEGMIALCPNCHMVKHIGFAEVLGLQKQAIQHFKKINGLTQKQAMSEIKEAFQVWEARSKKKWILDLSSLKEYGFEPNLKKKKKKK
jgi:hypothetical protein